MSNRDRDTAQRREGIERTARNIREDAMKSGRKDPGQEAAAKFVKDSVRKAEAQERK